MSESGAPAEEYKRESPMILEVGILPGVSALTIKKLLKAGIPTIDILAVQVASDLAKEADIGENTAQKAITAARVLQGSGFVTGKQLYDQYQQRTRLTTSSSAVDAILGGGIESETTTEIAAGNGVGKTQLCHVLAINAQQPVEEGGLGGKVVWVDTEGTFRPERIIEICKSRGLDSDEVLTGILVCLARSATEQSRYIRNLFSLCPEYDIKLIIVDSMIAHLRGEYLGRGMLSGRQDALKEMLQTLMKVAISTRSTVVYTNQILSDPSSAYSKDKPTGGNVMGHSATMRIEIRKGREGVRILKLTKSPYLEEAEAKFLISGKGIEDVKKRGDEEEEEDAP